MPEAYFYIESGEITNKSVVAKMFAELKDGRYLLKILNKNKRTIPMNAYLHGVLIPEFRKALVEVGYDEVKTDEQAKLIMKAMFLKRQEVNHQTGEVIEFIQDTHNLTTIEMSTLFEEVVKFAAENMNYIIALPNEQLSIEY